MTTWFTSDEHYDHKNIIEYCNRPFTDVTHQIEELIRRHNSVVQDDDVVWHLGDFCMNEKNVPKVLSRLRGAHYLVPGNHDRCHSSKKNHAAAVERYRTYGFCFIRECVDDMLGFMFHHMPYVGDSRHETRYSEYRPVDTGDWLLHGHIHDLWKRNDRMINVGVDVWNYAPVRYEILLEIKSDHSL